MNKKFSTLVAALLVSGVSYAVVGAFNAPALTNSPIAKAATANMNLRSAANYSVAPILYVANATKWSWAGTNLQTADGSVLAYKSGEVILLNNNLSVEGATKIDFTYTEYHLETKVVGGSDHVLAFDRATHAFSLQPKATINLDKYYYATLYSDESNRPASASTASYYIAEEIKDGMVGAQAAVVTATTFEFGQTTSFTNGADGVRTALANANVTIEASGNGDDVNFLKIKSAKGTDLYLHIAANGDMSYSAEKPANMDYASSAISVDATGYVKVGGSNYLEYNSGFAVTVSTHTTDKSVNLLAAAENTLAKSTLTPGSYYLLTGMSDTDAGNFAKTASNGNVVTLDPTVGSITAGTTPSISTPNQQITLTWNSSNTSFKLSQGLDYLKNDASLGEVDDAAEFTLSPEDGAVMCGTNFLLRATAGGGLSMAENVSAGTNEKVYLFAATAAESKPETAPTGEVPYILANATFTVPGLTTQYVIQATEDAGTPDVPDAGAKELINGANYFINDGTNYLAYVNGLVNDDSHSASDQTEMWIATEHKGANGEPTTYSFVNRSTEKGKLAFKVEFKNNEFPAEAAFDAEKGIYSQFFIDKDGKVSFTAKATDKTGKDVEQVYYLNLSGTSWKFIKDNSNVQNIKFDRTVEGMSLDANYLNNKAGNGSDFSFLFAANAKRDSLKPLDETVLSKTIVAVDAKTYTNVFKSYDGNDNYSAYAISDGLLFSTSVSNDAKKSKIENFRASKFIIVSPTAYSSIIEDKDDNQFFDYIEVSGSDLVDENGVLLADPSKYVATNDDIKKGNALAGVKYLFANAIFNAQQREGAQYSDPVYVTTPSAYYNPEANEDGLAGYKEATKLAIAVKKFQSTYYVGAAKNTDVTPRWENVYIGTNNDVTYKLVNGIVNIYNAKYDSKGEVYGNTTDAIAKLDTKYVTVNMNAPEGQFLVTYANNKFTFTNRESQKEAFGGSYGLKTVKDAKGNVIKDVYAVSNGTSTAAPDTVKIVSAMPDSKYDGYKNFDQKKYELTDSIYTMSFQPKVDGKEGLDPVYVAENHDTDHMLTLTTDDTDAARFSLIKFEGKKDTVYVSTGKYITSDGKLVDDQAVAFAYTIYNDDNNEYVNYNADKTKEYFFCDWNNLNTNAKATAQKYILKEKGGNNYQLIAVTVKADGKDVFNTAAKGKAYGAFQGPKVSEEANIYKVTDNDIVNISVIGAPMYRTVEAAPFDTIRIYKEGSKNVALYAETADQKIVSGSNFLAMGHKADVNTDVTKFSLFIDTAYVRGGTNKPQYMLVIEPDTVHGKFICNDPTHQPHDTGKIDTVYGKFLTTMIDSIPAWGNKHNNPYYWEESQYPRLGFVNAKHYGDSLVILKGNGIQHKTDTIDLKDNSNKFGVYAFRIVNDETKSFMIETAYDRKADGSFNTGWIKWLNGVPVVIPSTEKDKAEIFSLEATSNDPVANETISSASAISVVTTEGAVIVKGAEGKNVVITNVLGQTIANTVVTSSEATISAPAGIVVVAVEGEAAVKAVVK